MSLFSALSLGGSSLAAQQAALQTVGNNISNAGTAGYTRQAVNLAESGTTVNSAGVSVGSGVKVTSITRQVNDVLNESVRDANSDSSASTALNSSLTTLQNTFGALNDNDLSSQMTSFFNDFSTLANNPTDSSQRALVVQDGVTLSANIQSLRTQLTSQVSDINSQVQTTTAQANTLLTQIATLNKQITSGGGTNTSATNSLQDQRDQALSQLSDLMNINVVDQGDGSVNVLSGSTVLVSSTTNRTLANKQVLDANGVSNTQVTFADTGDPVNITSGQIGGLLDARDNYVSPAVSALDQTASGLIYAVNSIHTQGQGTAGFSSVTGTTAVTDPTAALNAGNASTGITYTPTNGTFDLYMTDATTGQTTTQQITVNLSGSGTQTSLQSLAASITAAGNGKVSANVDSTGHLAIKSSDSNVTFGFGSDTSGALTALGVNTYFSGNDASNIAVNSTLTTNSALLATGRNNVAGSNTNASALAMAGSASVSVLGGVGVSSFYTTYIGNLSTQASNASANATTTAAITTSLTSQQSSISGVSIDEETVNMLAYQRAFEGSAKYITVVDELMQQVLGLVQ